MFYKTYDESKKRVIAGCVETEVDGEIKSGHNACNCTCNCFCSCACFINFLDKDDSSTTLEENNYTKEEYLEKMLQV